jgi:hypothetical protein
MNKKKSSFHFIQKIFFFQIRNVIDVQQQKRNKKKPVEKNQDF